MSHQIELKEFNFVPLLSQHRSNQSDKLVDFLGRPAHSTHRKLTNLVVSHAVQDALFEKDGVPRARSTTLKNDNIIHQYIRRNRLNYLPRKLIESPPINLQCIFSILVAEVYSPTFSLLQLGAKRIRGKIFRLSTDSKFLRLTDVCCKYYEASTLMLDDKVDDLFILKKAIVDLSDFARLEMVKLSLLSIQLFQFRCSANHLF